MSATYFLTGTTGTVGSQVLNALLAADSSARVVLASRNPTRNPQVDPTRHPRVETRHFDFEDPGSFETALEGVSRVFFMRPPRLAKESTFAPFVTALERIQPEIVTFLSVAAAERVRALPHAKIEALLAARSLSTYFVRPEYFMSNLSIVFGEEIRTKGRLTLPSKDAKFNWIAPVDIGAVIARSLRSPADFAGQATHLTGPANYNFAEVCTLLGKLLERPITYRPVNPLRYLSTRPHASSLLEGAMFTLIHTLPRFFPEPTITEDYRQITRTDPTTLEEYLRARREKFTP